MAIEGDRAIGSLGDDLTWHEKTDYMGYSRYSGMVSLAVKRKAILGEPYLARTAASCPGGAPEHGRSQSCGGESFPGRLT